MKNSFSRAFRILLAIICLDYIAYQITYACDTTKEYLSITNAFNPRAPIQLSPDVIEFGFVLLSSQHDRSIKDLAECVHKNICPQSMQTDISESANIVTRMPHVSIGQYGIWSNEYDQLTAIVDDVADQFQPIIEPMASQLSVTEHEIFLDAKNINHNTNPILCDLYLRLRESYTNNIAKKFMIAQAVYEREQQLQKNNQFETDLICKYFQNWGIPEYNRMRPHYTLIYNYNLRKSNIEAVVQNLSVDLQTVVFDQLGIVSIDFWGNPKALLHVRPFKQISFYDNA